MTARKASTGEPAATAKGTTGSTPRTPRATRATTRSEPVRRSNTGKPLKGAAARSAAAKAARLAAEAAQAADAAEAVDGEVVEGEVLSSREDADPTAHLEAWDQQPGESDTYYRYFTVYRDLGRARTVKKAADLLQRSPRTIFQHSGDYRWVARAGAWDLEQEREFRESMVEDRRRIAREHLSLSTAMLAKARKRIEKLKPEDMSVQELSRFVDVAVKVQRLALGESTDNVAVATDGAGQVSAAAFAGMDPSDQQLRLLEIKREIERRTGEMGSTGSGEGPAALPAAPRAPAQPSAEQPEPSGQQPEGGDS